MKGVCVRREKSEVRVERFPVSFGCKLDEQTCDELVMAFAQVVVVPAPGVIESSQVSVPKRVSCCVP